MSRTSQLLIFVGAMAVGFLFHHHFVSQAAPSTKAKNEQVRIPTKSSLSISDTALKPTHNSSRIETSSHLAKTLAEARRVFPAHPRTSIELIGSLGLPPQISHKFFMELTKGLAPEKAFEILAELSSLPIGSFSTMSMGVFAERALPASEEAVLDYLEQNRPEVMRNVAKEIWLSNPQLARKKMAEMSEENALYFLAGPAGSNIEASARTVTSVVERIRALESEDLDTRHLLEGEFLRKNVAGNSAVIENYLLSSNSPVVLNKVLPPLALENGNGDWESALQWLQAYEGKEDSAAIKKLKRMQLESEESE